ncbi:hypothetical protein GOBAR_AA21399 [Gossypium barbadense]|uniref:Uncharacterized protein n=1 Tax=Gossypium barbadense TaxID=3634 RepID=A0A2P5X7G5_GOSBA|nr:hypothetical protein GOBAR_AA21399 [Gossypium barbadense]
MVTLQARDSIKMSSNEDDLINPVNKANHVVRSPLQETLSRNINELHPSSCINNGAIHERRMLQIDELEEWRTYDKEVQKQHHVESNERTNQFKVGDEVWLDKWTLKLPPQNSTLTERLLLRYSKSFHIELTARKRSFDSVIHRDHENTRYTITNTRGKSKALKRNYTSFIEYDPSVLHHLQAHLLEAHLRVSTTFLVQQVMWVLDEPGTITFFLGRLVRHMSVLEFGATLGLYTEEFMTAEDFLHLHRHIYYSPSRCWVKLTGGLTNYDASRSKATHLSPAL